MSTSTFIQVEGPITLPRVRPLGPVPLSFGREWMLTPPHFSLRAEIRALYAAIMRTVCLSAEAFRDVCRWDLQHHLLPEHSAAPVRPSATIEANQARAKERTLSHIDPARVMNSSHPPSSGAYRLAGGACAIGGAVVLAWIVASHMPRDERDTATVADTAPIRDAGGTASQRLADERAAHERMNATPATSTTSTVPSAVVSAPAARPSVVTPDYATAKIQTAPLRAKLSGHEGRANKPQRSVRGRASRIESSRYRAQSLASHRIASPVTTHRTRGMYSEASSYSPRQPSVRQDDDYVSIVTYATTHTAPRPAHIASAPVDGTEWVNHVSQRRVTEIPDRFAQ